VGLQPLLQFEVVLDTGDGSLRPAIASEIAALSVLARGCPLWAKSGPVRKTALQNRSSEIAVSRWSGWRESNPREQLGKLD